MGYRDYIQSQRWMQRKRKYFETHEKKCKACKTSRRIELHHKTYNRLGQERDADLVPLCQLCHSKVHDLFRSSDMTLWTATEEYIRRKKKRYKANSVKKRPTRKRKPVKR